ncbi:MULTISPECIES: hypothetical protein [Actinosynnema]|uniref:hypothetical protein n=1 Tax=Actinosynnema TaxID=40566 RepID=UPI0020A32302|nr:hypothetical protein [Actinosynnema pretiosum]MCP2093205.1 hypothetical protein [Actinosynnema pretiosum]
MSGASVLPGLDAVDWAGWTTLRRWRRPGASRTGTRTAIPADWPEAAPPRR